MEKQIIEKLLTSLYPTIIISNLGFLAVFMFLLNVFFNIEVNLSIKQRTFKKKTKEIETLELYQNLQNYSKMLEEQEKNKKMLEEQEKNKKMLEEQEKNKK